jgi:uncharacterized protein YqjF (DUF2071 family)
MANPTDRTWTLPKQPWVMRMIWSELLFAHWPVDPRMLAPLLPKGLELDTREGIAWIGVVPFLMSAVAPRGCPSLPNASRFLELNVRTYVTCDGKPGVWFFSLDAASRLAVRAARATFNLPYMDARMSLVKDKSARIVYLSERTHRGEPLGGQYIGMDDTSVTLLMPSEIPEANQECSRTMRLIEKMHEAKRKREKSLAAKMWAYSGGVDAPYDVFDFRVSRHRDGPAEFLVDYTGHVMADCYSGNLSVVLAPGSSMTRMACWSHARRHVHEAKDMDLSVSAMPLALINQLYDIERRGLEWSIDERTEVRHKESKLILDRLGEWLDGPAAKSVLPSSKLGLALNYVRNHWNALNVYATDGRLPIDNNWVERLMKRVAVGKKNWLFIGSLRAGIRNANLMTLVASAHRHDLDIFEYLRDVIEHLNRGTAPPSQKAFLDASYEASGNTFEAPKGTLEHWLTARYCFYSVNRQGRLYRGEIDHVPWRLSQARWEVNLNTMCDPLGLELTGEPHLLFAQPISVRAWMAARCD